MALEMILENLEGVNEEISKLYVMKDGKYHLDVTGDDKSRIPISRLNQEIEKRKEAEKSMKDIAESLIESIPEDMRDIIPNLSPAEKIRWIKSAEKKGLFTRQAPPIDQKKPGDKSPRDFSGLSPQTLMSMGYK